LRPLLRELITVQSREGDGPARLVLASGASLLHPEEDVFKAMLEGWGTQMRSRLLAAGSIDSRLRLVHRFALFTNDYPWKWSPADMEEWTSELVSGQNPLAHSTLRTYQQTIAMFIDYLIDPRYEWGLECESRFGTHPVQICHEWNTAAHVNAFEGRPRVRPFSRDELQNFFDFCDDQVERARKLRRKGWLSAFRDATLFKVTYAWGLRRREVAKLDIVDFGRNPAAKEFGDLGTLSVRWGKAARGSAPRRRNVLSVMGWAVDAVEQYLAEIRPLYADSGVLWPTERGGRVSTDYINVRFGDYRQQLGLPDELHPHCLRHSYVTHLIEDGFDAFFVQQQVGHAWGSTTALYTGVSGDYKNRVLRQALDGIYEGRTAEGVSR
jgi:integrase/recombinase XerC